MDLKDISFSIVLYNNSSAEITTLLNCIKNVRLKYHVYIVDNSPTDRLKATASEFENVYYYHSGDNMGYGKAHNHAIQNEISFSRYHVIVNPDVTFEIGTIEALYDFMEMNQSVGLIMPKVVYEDGSVQKLCKLLPKPSDLIIRRFIKTLGLPIKLKYELHDFAYDQIAEIPSLSGCFMFLRSEVLKKTGGFDPRFFLYLEDFDLSRRVAIISKTIFYPHVIVTHKFNRGSYHNFKLLKLHIVSAIKYFNKWGWFLDPERNRINKKTINQFRGR